MGFWWGHESTGTVAANGNPNGPCPQIVPGYPCERWGSNMTLINAGWSTKGKFRAGGAISFDGLNSYGVAKHIELWEGWGSDLTLGLTIHPTTPRKDGDLVDGVLVARAGSGFLQVSFLSPCIQWSWWQQLAWKARAGKSACGCMSPAGRIRAAHCQPFHRGSAQLNQSQSRRRNTPKASFSWHLPKGN